MKNKLLISVALTFAILISCGCKKDTSTSIQEQTPIKTASIMSGAVVAYFVDSVVQVRAIQFIQNMTLTVIDSSRYNLRSPHELSLQVPVGQELKWTDSLKTFPIIAAASPVYVVNE
jgi:hypothetical protein